MNAKLLDLKTGKYLDKGKDWLDGGEYICLYANNLFQSINNSNSLLTHKKCHVLIMPPALSKLCKATGACVYGWRYIMLLYRPYNYNDREFCLGDVLCKKDSGSQETIGFVEFSNDYYRLTCNALASWQGFNDGLSHYAECYGNLFEEYSKSIRGEENRFEEFMKLLDI